MSKRCGARRGGSGTNTYNRGYRYPGLGHATQYMVHDPCSPALTCQRNVKYDTHEQPCCLAESQYTHSGIVCGVGFPKPGGGPSGRFVNQGGGRCGPTWFVPPAFGGNAGGCGTPWCGPIVNGPGYAANFCGTCSPFGRGAAFVGASYPGGGKFYPGCGSSCGTPPASPCGCGNSCCGGCAGGTPIPPPPCPDKSLNQPPCYTGCTPPQVYGRYRDPRLGRIVYAHPALANEGSVGEYGGGSCSTGTCGVGVGLPYGNYGRNTPWPIGRTVCGGNVPGALPAYGGLPAYLPQSGAGCNTCGGAAGCNYGPGPFYNPYGNAPITCGPAPKAYIPAPNVPGNGPQLLGCMFPYSPAPESEGQDCPNYIFNYPYYG